MGWTQGWLRGAAIFVYVLVGTVWLPDFVLGLGPIASGSDVIQNLAVLAVWGGALGAGIFGLRRAQQRGLI